LIAAALASYLEANIDGFTGLQNIKKIDSGQSNPTHLIEAKNGRFLCKRRRIRLLAGRKCQSQ